MKFSKKYIAAGSAVIVSLSLCAYALNQHRSQENKDNNRVSYVDGSQSSQTIIVSLMWMAASQVRKLKT